MGLTERIEYINSSAIEMIASMARVSFREHYIDLYTNQHYTDKFAPDTELDLWSQEVHRNLPEDIQELLDKYFHSETAFGASVMVHILWLDVSSASDFIEKIKKMSPHELMHYFILIGLGPDTEQKSWDATQEIVERMCADEKEALMFITRHTFFSPEQKANLLDMFMDVNKTKDDLIYLFEWYYENVFSQLEQTYMDENKEQLERLKRIIEREGDDYFKKLGFMLFMEKASKIYLGVSKSLGLSLANAVFLDKGCQLYILGYDHIMIPFHKIDPKVEAMGFFKCFTNEQTVEIYKMISRGRRSIQSLIRETSQSASEISDHLHVLAKAELIDIDLENGDVVAFALNVDLEEKTMASLKRLMKVSSD